jgi:hypothetical protein
MVPLAVEAAEQRKGPAAAGAQIPPSDYRVRKVRFLPSANTMRGARDGSVATKPANQGRAPRSKRRGQFSLNALAFGGRGVSRLRALATVSTIGERPKRKARHLRRALQFRPLPSVNRRVSTLGVAPEHLA